MTELESITVGKSSIPALIITAVLMAAIPVVCFILRRKRHRERTNIAYLIAGAVGFIVSARVLELGVHYLCIMSDNAVSRFINGSTAAYVLYGTVTAGVFEECGRHIILRYLMKKNRTRENAVMYGIGHGGIELLAVILPTMITYLAVAVLFSAGDRAAALSTLKITEETAAAALPSVRAAAAFDYAAMTMNVIERVFAMLVHIGLTVIVFYGVVRSRKGCLPLAILLHMIVDTFPALCQRGAVPLWSVEVWAAAWTAVIILIAAKLYKGLKAQPEEAGE